MVANLLTGTEYEIKIRPYFDEFQGKDSRLMLIRTAAEGKTGLKLLILTTSDETDTSPFETEALLIWTWYT